jgi:ribonuclease Z
MPAGLLMPPDSILAIFCYGNWFKSYLCNVEKFEVLILGCGSAKPSMRHLQSAQIVNVHEKLYMIDCGEGAQIQMCRNKVSLSRLTGIFISHLHGDHFFGLIGLLSTLSLLGRTADLHIFAPPGLEATMTRLCQLYCKDMKFRTVFHETDTSKHELIYEDRTVEISTIPLRHRIPCCGFMVSEKQKLPHIKRDMIDFYHIPVHAINGIKLGIPWTTPDGETIACERLTTPADKARTYAYCSDTSYIPQIHEMLKDVDLLYHEATFGTDNEQRADETFHSTAQQAAMVARDAGVHKLVIGHFSSRYTNENELLRQAREVFPNTELANENKTFAIQ